MLKRNMRPIVLLVLLTLIPLSVYGATATHLLWDIPPTVTPDELMGIVQERSGIVMEASSYGNSVYLSSGYTQPITMFGMPVSLSASFENDTLDSISIFHVGQDGIFYEGIDPTAEQQDEAALRGLVCFLEIAKQVEEKFGNFTGGQITEVGEPYADFPVDAQGGLDMAAFQDAMWYSNETTVELHNENIMIGLKSFFDYDGDGDTLWCLSLYVSFAYGGKNSQESVRAFPGAYPDVGAMLLSLQGDVMPTVDSTGMDSEKKELATPVPTTTPFSQVRGVTDTRQRMNTTGEWRYDIMDGGARIVGISDAMAERLTLVGSTMNPCKVIIPDELDGYPVTAIGDEVFAGYYNLTEVLLPGSIESIGNGAFERTSLARINFPYGIKSIGSRAFYATLNDESVGITIPSSVTELGYMAFAFNRCTFNVMPGTVPYQYLISNNYIYYNITDNTAREKVSIVAGVKPPQYPQATLGEAFEAFFTGATWDGYREIADGMTYVTFEGAIREQGRSVNIRLKYMIWASGIVRTVSYERDGREQNQQLYAELLRDVYAGYRMDENTAISMVKEGRLNAYPHMTVGEGFARFFNELQWNAVSGTDGFTYVNVDGGAISNNRPVQVFLQFKVADNGNFECVAFEINGAAQNQQSLNALLQSIFQ